MFRAGSEIDTGLKGSRRGLGVGHTGDFEDVRDIGGDAARAQTPLEESQNVFISFLTGSEVRHK